MENRFLNTTILQSSSLQIAEKQDEAIAELKN